MRTRKTVTEGLKASGARGGAGKTGIPSLQSSHQQSCAPEETIKDTSNTPQGRPRKIGRGGKWSEKTTEIPLHNKKVNTEKGPTGKNGRKTEYALVWCAAEKFLPAGETT